MVAYLGAASVLVLLGGPARAAAGPEAPVEATFTVRLSSGKTTYALGELIPLDLEFRGQADADYYFSTARYESLGRLGPERCRVEPEAGTVDPIADYLSSAGIAGGIPSGWHPLDGTPLVLRAHLNEWVRFTKPGEYRLVVESRRLERYSRQPAPTLTSAPVTIRVVAASAEWAGGELKRATDGIEGRGPATPREAVTILRHLGTRGAALALVRFYGAGGPRLRFDWSAGLAASPHRREVVKAMEARIDSGEAPPAGFVRDLALLRTLLDLPAGPPGDRFQLQASLACDYARRAVGALSRRDPDVPRLTAALRALEDPPDAACGVSLGELLDADAAASREAFLSLPAQTQSLLLQHRWDAISGAWLQAAAEAVFERWQGDGRIPGAGDAALRRLAELDRARARVLAVEELRTGTRRIVPETLEAIVEPPLPDGDGALLDRYRSARDDEARAAAMALIANYGGPSLLPVVIAELDDGPDCALEAAALAFLLRHEPTPALQRLQPGFDRKHPPTCATPPWDELGRRRWSADVETAAIAHLQGREPWPVALAARALGAYGTPRAKAALFGRLASWSEEWKGREGEIEALAARPTSLDSHVVLEGALVSALLEARSFELDGPELARVRDLCVTEGCRQNVDARVRAGRPPRPPSVP